MTARVCLMLMLILALPTAALAQTWQAKQGDILPLTLSLPAGQVRVTAFGKSWPWRRLADGRIRTWIGIDMQAKPGDYTLLLRVEDGKRRWQRRDVLKVRKADFPVSRITVARRMSEFDAATLARIRRDQAKLKRSYSASVNARPDFRAVFLPVQGPISSPFGAQRIVNGKPRSPHSGIDIAAPAGAPVRTPMAGKVLLVDDMYLNGKTIAIGHGDGLVSVFSHLKQTEVEAGQWLAAGTVIGKVGATGRATGPHLHWGVRFQQARVNPLSLLAGGAHE